MEVKWQCGAPHPWLAPLQPPQEQTLIFKTTLSNRNILLPIRSVCAVRKIQTTPQFNDASIFTAKTNKRSHCEPATYNKTEVRDARPSFSNMHRNFTQ